MNTKHVGKEDPEEVRSSDAEEEAAAPDAGGVDGKGVTTERPRSYTTLSSPPPESR
jgi:hypothetical protein